MKKINMVFAMASVALVSIPFAVSNNKPVQAYAGVEENERIFGSQNNLGEWSNTAYDKVELDPSATMTKKGEFHANLGGYNAEKVTQGFYKIGPKNQDVGKKGYIMVMLKSVAGDVKLADINLSLKRRGKEGSVTFNGTEWLNELGETLPELTNKYQIYTLHMPTMFKTKPTEAVDWTEIHFHTTSLLQGKKLGIKYLYYADNKTDTWGDKGVYQIDDFNRFKLNDGLKVPNAFWVDGAGSSVLVAPSYKGNTLTLASKTHGNVDGKFSNLTFAGKSGAITSLTPIYDNGNGYVNGDEVLFKDLRTEENKPLAALSSTWNHFNINLANSGIKCETFAGFKIVSSNTYLSDFTFTNNIDADLNIFAHEIIDKTQAHCNYKDPEVIKTIGNSWKELETKWNNMSKTAKDAFLTYKSKGNIPGKELNIITAPKVFDIKSKYKYQLGYTIKDVGTDFETLTMVVNSDKDIARGLASVRFEFVSGADKVTKWFGSNHLKDAAGKTISSDLKAGINTIVIDLAKTGIDGSKVTNIHVHSGNAATETNPVKFTVNTLKLSAKAKVDPLLIVDEAKARYNDIVCKYLGQYGVTDFLGIANANHNAAGMMFNENTSLITIITISIISISIIALLFVSKRNTFKKQ